MDDLTFEGITAIESTLRRRHADIAYVRVWDRTNREQEEALGRFDLSLEDARPYLVVDEPDVPAYAFELDAEDEDDEQMLPEPTGEELADAAVTWLRQLLSQNTLGMDWARYRVRLYGPGGVRTVHTGTVIVRAAAEIPGIEVGADQDDLVGQFTAAQLADDVVALHVGERFAVKFEPHSHRTSLQQRAELLGILSRQSRSRHLGDRIVVAHRTRVWIAIDRRRDRSHQRRERTHLCRLSSALMALRHRSSIRSPGATKRARHRTVKEHDLVLGGVAELLQLLKCSHLDHFGFNTDRGRADTAPKSGHAQRHRAR